MDKKLKDLKKDIDSTISSDAYFTEQDRQRFWKGVREMKTAATPRRMKLWPTLLTATAVGAFILALGTLAGKEIGLFPTSEKPQTEPPQENVPLVTDPEDTNKHGEIDSGMDAIHFQDIEGDTVIWSGTNDLAESDSISYDMQIYNMRTKKFGETITSDFGFEVYGGQINEDWITWVDAGVVNDSGRWRIYAINRKTDEKKIIRESTDVPGYGNPNVIEPRITMSSVTNRLTWAEPVAGENKMLVQLFDLDSGDLQTIGETDNENNITKLSDDYLFWKDVHEDFIVYSIEEGKVESTLMNNVVTYAATLNDRYVVWLEATETSDTRLVMSAIEGSKEVELFRGDINTFEIGDDYVVWESDQTIYAYSWANRETKEIGRNGQIPVIRGNTVIWQQMKEGSESTKLQVLELDKPEFDDYQDKMIDKEDLGKRNEELENYINEWLATNDVFGTDLKNGLFGAYLDEKGTVVVDFVPFANIIGVPAWEERKVLLEAMNEIIFSQPEVKEIYYTFNLNFTAFGDWTEVGEHVYTRDDEYQEVPSDQLSIEDSEKAYEMCVNALNDYYKAVWNGSDIELDTFIVNDNLKQYTQMKVQSQHDLHAGITDKVKNIEIDDWEVEYTDDADGGFLYLHLPVHINKFVGGYGEGTEFLVRKVKGKLVIVDWYTGAKDSYDFMVRGENQTIDNPTIWNDSEWVKKLKDKQIEFSGSTR